MLRHATAMLLIAAGAAALLALARSPLEPRWSVDDPGRGGHVTAAAERAGQVVAARQDGSLVVRRDGAWEDGPGLPEAARSTVLLGAGPLRAGTRDGVLELHDGEWRRMDTGEAPEGRISGLAAGDGRLLAAGQRGVWERPADAAWRFLGHPAPGLPVYRIHATADGTLHAGVIEAGVHVRAPGDDGWEPDRDGLPADVKILSFLALDDDTLLAGTDQGLYRQDGGPGAEWEAVSGALERLRILSLARERDRLLLGNDDGVLAAPLGADGALPERPEWREVRARAEQLDAGVAWIIPDAADGPWIAAGSLYRLRSGLDATWLTLALVGPLLLIAGGGLLVRRR